MIPYINTASGDSGVYKLLVGPVFYIGSCSQFGRRLAGHRSDLTAGKHPNKRLQAAWDEHKTTELFILKNVPRKAMDVESDKDHAARLKHNEQKFLDAEFDHPLCANESRNSRYNTKIADQMRAKWQDPEWRGKVSKKLADSASARVVSQETREKMAKAKRGKNNVKSRPVVCFFKGKRFDFESASNAANHFGVGQQAMHGWLSHKFCWPGTGPRNPKPSSMHLIGLMGHFVDDRHGQIVVEETLMHLQRRDPQIWSWPI